MERLSVSEVARVCGGVVVAGDANTIIGCISIDTRKLQPGDFYIAIKGKHRDGHQFVAEALEKGAKGVMVERLPDRVGREWNRAGAVPVVVQVVDTRSALLALARWYRSKLAVRVVAVTGSNGKTTTKEMLAAILTERWRVVSAPASFNNDIGVPLTVLMMDKNTEVAIFEIEMNEPGGTLRLARVCQPEIGIVTNIGDTHLEFMKDRQGVAAEKAELIAALPKGGVAVVNADDPLVRELVSVGQREGEVDVVRFGLGPKADVFGTDVVDQGIAGTRFLLQGKYPVRLPVPGRHNIVNFLAAAAAARALGVPFEAMVSAIERFVPAPHRLAVRRLNGVVLIDDTFNANPQSMAAALAVLTASAPKEKRVAVLGDMLELGESSYRLHQELGYRVGESVDRLVVVGNEAMAVVRGAEAAGLASSRIRVYRSGAAVGDELFDILQLGDTILVKGSRLMALEKITERIARFYGEKNG